MDFLIVFGIYVVLTFLGMVVFLYTDSIGPLIPNWLVSSIFCVKDLVSSGIKSLLPKYVQGLIMRFYEYVFFSKNPVFMVLYLFIVLGGHMIYGLGCLPYLYAVDPHSNHVFVPMVVFFANTVVFIVSCLSDPGVIHSGNHESLKDIYEYDGLIYQEGAVCCTCKRSKPARSKHCTFTDRCYFKFDHYCVWINNTVAVYNHRYFVLFLLSLCVLCANGIVYMFRSILSMAHVYKLWQARYIDGSGQSYPMDWPTLIQTLFMRHPYVVFLSFVLCFTLPIIFVLLCYHTYLFATNQTTNERYKKHYIKREKKNIGYIPNPYNKGILRNFVEAIFPLSDMKVCNGKTFSKKVKQK